LEATGILQRRQHASFSSEQPIEANSISINRTSGAADGQGSPPVCAICVEDYILIGEKFVGKFRFYGAFAPNRCDKVARSLATILQKARGQAPFKKKNKMTKKNTAQGQIGGSFFLMGSEAPQ
jgi:hypothetical protein